MSNVVLVVDMLIGFMEPGKNLYCGDEARQIIPNIKRLIESEQAAGSSIIFIADTHHPDDLEFEMFPVHCVRGTEECEVIPELADYVTVTLRKRRYSAFYETDLEKRLKTLNPEKIILVGVCTDICVMHTTADARNRDYAVEVPIDCVASFDPDAHRHALDHMEKILGAKLTSLAPS
jgi:nicotinamidase/pyrazinamidase|tara:strand:- start:3200 stop:3730 length:531 start_codon:yes stop_codon:yes gene_type:complete